LDKNTRTSILFVKNTDSLRIAKIAVPSIKLGEKNQQSIKEKEREKERNRDEKEIDRNSSNHK